MGFRKSFFVFMELNRKYVLDNPNVCMSDKPNLTIIQHFFFIIMAHFNIDSGNIIFKISRI